MKLNVSTAEKADQRTRHTAPLGAIPLVECRARAIVGRARSSTQILCNFPDSLNTRITAELGLEARNLGIGNASKTHEDNRCS